MYYCLVKQVKFNKEEGKKTENHSRTKCKNEIDIHINLRFVCSCKRNNITSVDTQP